MWDDRLNITDGGYKNAISNELFWLLGTQLFLQTKNPYFFSRAQQIADWFLNKSTLINSQWLINDGLDSFCKNNGGSTWRYTNYIAILNYT